MRSRPSMSARDSATSIHPRDDGALCVCVCACMVGSWRIGVEPICVTNDCAKKAWGGAGEEEEEEVNSLWDASTHYNYGRRAGGRRSSPRVAPTGPAEERLAMDAMSWEEVLEADLLPCSFDCIDNIVLSPGPGSPARAEVRELLRKEGRKAALEEQHPLCLA
eukprot:GHVU01134242.1.p2 GENE.GHVU01134242.1~~GHVU01134242.1.p2  ORF type:complete len:163 (-),score=30.07 GHVU01134242.1:845-1333(-)